MRADRRRSLPDDFKSLTILSMESFEVPRLSGDQTDSDPDIVIEYY